MKKPRDNPPQLFQPGHAKLGGRTKGSRNMLCEGFVADLCDEWREHGKSTLRIVRIEEPATFVRVVASVIPKEFDINTSQVADISDERLNALLAFLDERIAGELAGNDGGSGETSERENKARSVN